MAAYIKRPDGSFVYFDVTTEEQLGGDSDITDYPVEEGPNITDHIQPNLSRITIKCFLTNEPIVDNGRGMTSATVTLPTFQQTNPLAPNLGSLTRTVENAVSSLFSTPGPTEYNVSVLSFPFFDAVRDMLGVVEDMRLGREMLTVVTSKKAYDNMALSRWDLSRDAQTGTGAELSLEFKQIVTVSVSVDIAPLPTEPRGRPPKTKGTKDPPAADPGPKESVAKVIIPAAAKALGNFLGTAGQ